jgi:hypothetical protein
LKQKVIELIENLKEQLFQIYNMIINYNFSNILQGVRGLYKSNSKTIKGFFALVGLLILVTHFTYIYTATRFQENIPQNWYEQLPDNHWIKVENKNNYDPLHELDNIRNVLKVYSNTFTDLSIEMLGQTKFLGKIMSLKAKDMKKNEQDKYFLQIDETHKKIKNNKKLILKEGDQLTVSYYYNNQKLRFDYTKDEFIESNAEILNTFVFSYIEDTNIVTFSDGKIIGKKKGNTSLVISNGYNTSIYIIKVSSK